MCSSVASCSCPWLRKVRRSLSGGRARSATRGYALLVVMLLATILLVSLTAAVPNLYLVGQREREEELIFRGNEYARAIALFNRQFRRYPTSTKELLETNGIRFLRREYRDPMTRHGKWRFIHGTGTGAVLDSRTMGLAPAPGGQEVPAGTVPATPTARPKGDEEGAPEQRPASAFFTDEVKGAFIVGVASRSRRNSIRVLNGRTRYDEWEFLGLPNLGAGGFSGGGGAAPGMESGTGRTEGGVGFKPIPPLTDEPIPASKD